MKWDVGADQGMESPHVLYHDRTCYSYIARRLCILQTRCIHSQWCSPLTVHRGLIACPPHDSYSDMKSPTLPRVILPVVPNWLNDSSAVPCDVALLWVGCMVKMEL